MTAIRTGTSVQFGIVPYYSGSNTSPYPPMQHMNNRYQGNYLISANHTYDLSGSMGQEQV